ncbi:GNAT family N-acetyltransferase [Flexivirga sp. B27]
MNTPDWSLRTATYDDAILLGEIVIEATKDQGRWPQMSDDDEAEWLRGFAEWSRECVDAADGPGRLEVIEIDGAAVGRLRTARDTGTVDGEELPRVTLSGLQLRPAVQDRGVGTSIIRTLQDEVSAAGGVLDLGVEHTNPNARRLYERLGFVAVGTNDDEVEMRWTPGGKHSDTVTRP